jgi:hypothetical protein
MLQTLKHVQAMHELNKHADLFYKFAPTLLQHVPGPTVDMLIEIGQNLDQSKFIPALMRYEATVARELKDGDTNDAIRYLENCVGMDSMGQMRSLDYCVDPTVHNFLVTLYTKQKDEEPLLDFIRMHQNNPLYDYKYALRLCHQHGKQMSMVAIYTAMKHFEEAVMMALLVDVEEAKKFVSQSRFDEEKKKTLAPDCSPCD